MGTLNTKPNNYSKLRTLHSMAWFATVGIFWTSFALWVSFWGQAETALEMSATSSASVRLLRVDVAQRPATELALAKHCGPSGMVGRRSAQVVGWFVPVFLCVCLKEPQQWVIFLSVSLQSFLTKGYPPNRTDTFALPGPGHNRVGRGWGGCSCFGGSEKASKPVESAWAGVNADFARIRDMFIFVSLQSFSIHQAYCNSTSLNQ